eukprot:scaffold20358_cov59-Cylindrotheca_fusiformis.AAC.2
MDLKNYFRHLATDIGASRFTVVPDHALSHEPRRLAHYKLCGEAIDAAPVDAAASKFPYRQESSGTLSSDMKQQSRHEKKTKFNRIFDQVDTLAPRFPCRRESPDILSIERKRHNRLEKKLSSRKGADQRGRIPLTIDDVKTSDQAGIVVQRHRARTHSDSCIVEAPKCPMRRESSDDLVIPSRSLGRQNKR